MSDCYWCPSCGRVVDLVGGRFEVHEDLDGWRCQGSEGPRIELEVIYGRPIHPAASVWPLMPDDELEALAADIADRGQQTPIALYGHLVIDGRNRLRACELACVRPRFDSMSIEGDPAAFVVSANLHRRHLTTSQRAMVAARLADLPRGRRPQSGHLADIPTQAEAADMLGVGERTVRRAREVLQAGDPDVVAEVERGEITVAEAVERVRPEPAPEPPSAPDPAPPPPPLGELPPEEQLAAIVGAASPEVLRQIERQVRDERREATRARRRERELAQAEAAQAAAPEVGGVEIRLTTVAALIEEMVGAGASLIHADPPWEFEVRQRSGAAESHYGTMAIEDIVDDLADAYAAAGDDSILAVWCTWQHLPQLLAEIDRREDWTWGPIASAGAWYKPGQIGLGRLWRGQTEPVLLFERGSVGPSRAIRNGHSEPRSAHSEKPIGWLRDWVEAWVPPGGLVLDLYAGRAPLARACAALGRRYVGAEIDRERRALALGELAADTGERQLVMEV